MAVTTEIKGFFGEHRFLSNFSPHGFWFMGFWYRTNEHFYQSAKCADSFWQHKIREAVRPAKAKEIGQTVQLHPNWDEMKLDVMQLGLKLKFTNANEIRELLLATENAYLEETNTWGDTYWGVCDGTGHNWLGSLLMDLREDLRDE